MQIEIENLEEITVIPEKFKNEENPPKFIFKTPNAADVIDFQIFNDITRVANRCFVRFENKPTLQKDGKALEYNTYAEFIGLGASGVINEIHAECCAKLLPVILGIKEKAEKTEKKVKIAWEIYQTGELTITSREGDKLTFLGDFKNPIAIGKKKRPLGKS